MNTFALLATVDHLKSPDPESVSGYEILNRRHIKQEPARPLLKAGNDGAAVQAKSETVGIRMACRSVVRWYHGGINE